MKNILCFGDSNTYGLNPVDASRFPIDVRWTGVLQSELGQDYHIIEEGLCGRTISLDDNIGINKNGKTHIVTSLYSHSPIDLAIVMLGTNDLKVRFSMTARDIALSMKDLIQIVLDFKQESNMKVLLVAPIALKEETTSGETFGNRNETSRRLTPLYKQIADEKGIEFFTLLDLVEPSNIDGIHLEGESHGVIGRELAKKILEIL